MPFTSLALLWREQKQDLGLWGLRCRRCGTIMFPRRRVCLKCRAKDDFDDIKLSRRGKIVTFTAEYMPPVPDIPLGQAVVDLDGGGRMLVQATDCEPEQLKIGQPVELVFRMLHESKGFYNYFWKCRPIGAESTKSE